MQKWMWNENIEKLNNFSVGAKDNKILFILSASDHSELIVLFLIIKEMYFNINCKYWNSSSLLLMEVYL